MLPIDIFPDMATQVFSEELLESVLTAFIFPLQR